MSGVKLTWRNRHIDHLFGRPDQFLFHILFEHLVISTAQRSNTKR